MLKILSVICVLSIIVTAGLGTEAGAATCPKGYTYRCPTVGGTRVCSCWKTGSEICDVEVTGLDYISDCVPGVNCPVVTCSVYGTVDLGDGLCNPKSLDPDCGIEGISFTLNTFSLNTVGEAETDLRSFPTKHWIHWQHPQGHWPHPPKPTPTPTPTPTPEPTGVPVIVETPLSNSEDIVECDEGGVCQKSIEVELMDCSDCPANSITTFTASTFNAEVCVCAGGFSTEGDCCADITRRIDGSCTRRSEEICLVQQCTADLTLYEPGMNIPYDCVKLKDERHECKEHGHHGCHGKGCHEKKHCRK